MIKTKHIFLSVCLCLLAAQLPAREKQRKDVQKSLSSAEQKKFDYYFYEGVKLKEDKKYDEALETFNACYAIDSLDAGVNGETGVLYASVGMTDEAERRLLKALDGDPGNWWYHLQLVNLYVAVKKPEKALSIAQLMQKSFPKKDDTYSILSTLYKQSGQFQKSIDAYNKLEQINGIDESVSYEKYQLYMLLKKPKNAIAEIDRLIAKYPTESRYQVLRGDIYMQQNMPDKALGIYQNVLETDPENGMVYLSLSEYYKAANEPAKALEAIVGALKSDKLPVETKTGILGEYIQKLSADTATIDETESLFKLLVEKYPLEEQVHSYYATFLQFRHRNAEAEGELETMLTINPKNEQTWLQLIQMNMEAKKYDKTLDITKKAIAQQPENPVWYFYKGITEFQLNDYKSSLESNQKGLTFVKSEQFVLKSNLYAQIGDIYFKQSEKEKAFENYNKALDANPNNVFVMNNYAYYLSLEKRDLGKAERLSAKTVEAEPKNSTYLDTYAWVLFQEGNYSLAKLYIQMAVDNLGKEEEPGVVYEHCGDIFWKNNEPEKALDMWKKSYDAGNKTDTLKKKIETKKLEE